MCLGVSTRRRSRRAIQRGSPRYRTTLGSFKVLCRQYVLSACERRGRERDRGREGGREIERERVGESRDVGMPGYEA